MVKLFHIEEEAAHKLLAFHIHFLESDQEDRLSEGKKCFTELIYLESVPQCMA